jgi:hypothetical protein
MSEATPSPEPSPVPAPAAAATPGTLADPPPGVDYPGKTLGIVGLVLVFLTVVIGLILSIVANGQSKAAGYKNTPAKIGIILGIVFLVLGLIGAIIAIIVAVTVGASVVEACQDLGPGVHEVDGVTYTCS